MAAVNVHIVNAFVEDDGSGGNPAGVVLNASKLSPVEKQAIAAQVGLSETAFVSASQKADVRLEFFTPTRQVPDCGHATVAAFTLLLSKGLVPTPETSKETIGGVRRIVILGKEISLEQPAPELNPIEDVSAVLEALGLSSEALLEKPRPVIAGSEMPYLIVPLRDALTLQSIEAQREKLLTLSKKLNVLGFYLFTRETHRAGRDAAARFFAPAAGIDEEAATGTAAGPLACYLRDCMGVLSDTFVIEQGRLMENPSPSKLVVRLSLDSGKITGLMVSGRAMAERTRDITVGAGQQ